MSITFVSTKFGGAFSRITVVGEAAGSQSAGSSVAVASGAQGKDHAPPPGQHLQFMSFVEAARCYARLGQFIILTIIGATAHKLLCAIGIVETCKFLLGRWGSPIRLVVHTLTPPTVLFRPKQPVIAASKEERSPQTFLQLYGAGMGRRVSVAVYLLPFQEPATASAVPVSVYSPYSTSSMRGQGGYHTQSSRDRVPFPDRGQK
jgi:hypothetical protein